MPDNWHRVGAPGGAGPLARASRPGDPHPLKAYGSRNLGVDRPSQGRSGSLANSPAPLGAPTLFLRDGKRENGGPARVPEFKARVREALANVKREVGR